MREVIDCARDVTGRKIAVQEAPRRPGDPPILVADTGRAKAELGWRPKFAELDAIVRTAWAWEKCRTA